MSAIDCVDTDFEDIYDVKSEEFNYLDSNDDWLTFDPNITFTQSNVNDLSEDKDINVWIRSAFCSEKSRGSHMTLVNKLDELKLLSPSIDSRTFTRQKRNLHKRQSLFNGNGLSTLCSPVTEDEYSSPETNDRTFEVQTNRKSLNGTFTKMMSNDTTFTFNNDEDIQLNNIDDVEKIAKLQEDSLRQHCSNGWSSSRQRSPPRNQLINTRLNFTNNNINSNTLTKSRDPSRHARTAEPVMDDFESYELNNEEDDHLYSALSPEENFTSHMTYNTSTPLVSKTYRNFGERLRQPIASKIMPDVSNLRAHSSYGNTKIGRSEPNLSKRLQPIGKGMAYISTKANHFGNRTAENGSNRTFLESKAPSDSRLIVKNGLRAPQNHNQMQTLGRITSPPPPSQSQQLLNRKVAVEGELNRIGTTTTTNLCRKSTFRVRDYAINSEENLRENGIDLCLTNHTNASTNGYQTNKTNNNSVQRNVSKIPGPKSVRSGIPVCGQRTAMQCPTNYRPTNHTDNSWKNGCF